MTPLGDSRDLVNHPWISTAGRKFTFCLDDRHHVLTGVDTHTVASRTCRLFTNYEARGCCLLTTKKYKYEASIVIINILFVIIYDRKDSGTSV